MTFINAKVWFRIVFFSKPKSNINKPGQELHLNGLSLKWCFFPPLSIPKPIATAMASSKLFPSCCKTIAALF
jgi:hypothetical protein